MPDSIESLVDSALAETPLATEQPATTDPAPSAPAEATGQTVADAPVPGMIGMKAEQTPTESETEAAKWKLEAAPDLVIAISEDGKPITAAEVQAGWMRQADYTRKTQEYAEFRKKAEPDVAFMDENRELIRDLNSGDPAKALGVLQHLAKEAGVDLGQARTRNERGQFAKAETEADNVPDLYNLEDFEEGTDEYEMAVKWNAQVEKNQAFHSEFSQMKTKFETFMGAVEQVSNQGKAQEEAETIASEWRTSGLQSIDINSAIELVGKPMTVEQAMHVAHFQEILAHNARVAGGQKQTPNEPGGVPAFRGVDAAGLSIEALVDQVVR